MDSFLFLLKSCRNDVRQNSMLTSQCYITLWDSLITFLSSALGMQRLCSLVFSFIIVTDKAVHFSSKCLSCHVKNVSWVQNLTNHSMYVFLACFHLYMYSLWLLQTSLYTKQISLSGTHSLCISKYFLLVSQVNEIMYMRLKLLCIINSLWSTPFFVYVN